MSIASAYYTHITSTVLDAPIEVTWPVVRDIVKIVEIVVGSMAEDAQWRGGGSVDHVPSSFTFDLAGGGPRLHQEVIARSEVEHTIVYCARNPALSMAEYTGTIRLFPVTLPAGQTFVVYERNFSLVPGSDPAVELPMLIGIMGNEMVALRAYFARSQA
jgi:hypothetical protein